MRLKKCKICSLGSGRRNVCEDCKLKYPYKLSPSGGKPFNRRDLYEKDQRKKKWKKSFWNG